MPIKITDELKEYLLENLHVKKVYFTADGSYSAHSYVKNGKAYTRLIDDALAPNAGQIKFFEVVAVFSRDQILGVKAPATDEKQDEVKK